MIEEQKRLEMGERLKQGILLAHKRMLHEKALHNRDIILGDGNGGVVRVSAKDFLAEHKEYQ